MQTSPQLEESSEPIVRRRESQSQDGRRRKASSNNITVTLSPHQYESLDKEFKCPICRNIFDENPKWLPCGHVFCTKCVKNQITREKQGEKLCKCAECKIEFSHRNLKEIKRFNRMLEIWRTLRISNNLCTQIPASFAMFDPQAFVANFRRKKQQNEEEKKQLSSVESNHQRSELDNLLSDVDDNENPAVDDFEVNQEEEMQEIKFKAVVTKAPIIATMRSKDMD